MVVIGVVVRGGAGGCIDLHDGNVVEKQICVVVVVLVW